MYRSFNQADKGIRAALLMAAALLISNSTNALAQSAPAANSVQPGFMAGARMGGMQQQQQQRPMRRYTGQQDYMYQTQELKQPVSLPYFPNYRGQGSSFTSGVYYPKLKARQCYLMRFVGKESPYEIMRLYKESLAMSGWQVNEAQTNQKQLTATKKDSGLYLTLCAYPSSKPGFKSSFEIKYLSAGAVQVQ